MRIHSKSQLFSAPARFFPTPSTVPEEDADVVRFQHHEPVALGLESKTKEIAVERDRSIKVRNLKKDVIDLRYGGRLRFYVLPENSDGPKGDVNRITGYAKDQTTGEVKEMMTHKDGLGWVNQNESPASILFQCPKCLAFDQHSPITRLSQLSGYFMAVG
jgi:hypothetical protein